MSSDSLIYLLDNLENLLCDFQCLLCNNPSISHRRELEIVDSLLSVSFGLLSSIVLNDVRDFSLVLDSKLGDFCNELETYQICSEKTNLEGF